jgi:Tol biopolymer transport system component
MKRTNLLLTVLTAATLTVVMTATMALPVSADRGHHEGGDAGANGGSPTNGQIVFRRYFDAEQTKGALFVIDPDGSDVHRITFPPDGWRDNVPAWSPDGKKLVFERFKSDGSTSRVMVVNPDTGDTRAVVPCTGHRCVYATDPYVSPDGQSIAYARTVAPPNTQDAPAWTHYSAIFIVGLDGSDPHQVSSTPQRHPGQLPTFDTSDPTFSPNV